MKLYIFDLDGTLVDNMDFYRKAYSENLEKLVREKHGEDGIKVVDNMRRINRGKGEFALFLLNISYDEWFGRVTDEDLNLVIKNPLLVKAIKNLDGIKVVYTGSSRKLAGRMLTRIGFDETDFDEIIAFEKPAVVPMKMTADKFIFKHLLDKFKIAPKDAYMVGDEYEFDLLPAKELGINIIEVRNKSGLAEHFVENILDLPKYLKSIQ